MGIKKQRLKSNKIKTVNASSEALIFERPVFAFFTMRKNYHIDKCNNEEKSALALKLSKIGQLTWQELNNSSKHGLGYESIKENSIIGDSTEHLPKGVKLIAFRFYAKAPIVGYRLNGVFHIVWLDRNFKLYKH